MPKRKQAIGEWWHDFFPHFRPFFDSIHPRTTQAEVAAVVRYLGLKRDQSLLDCLCGPGRIAIPLAKRGIRVTGVDFLQEYLDELDAVASAGKFPVETHRADMRKITFDREFDAAANLWTSFGFFEKESDNQLVLKRMYRALKPGGKFLLHLINRDWIIRHYTTEGWVKTRAARYFERRHFDFATSTNHDRALIIHKNKRVDCRNQIRMYSLHELIRMFAEAGFVRVAGYGGYHAEPVNLESRMLWVLGTRPRR